MLQLDETCSAQVNFRNGKGIATLIVFIIIVSLNFGVFLCHFRFTLDFMQQGVFLFQNIVYLKTQLTNTQRRYPLSISLIKIS